MVRRIAAQRETRTPLDLARALLRYGRMSDPCRAYDRMYAEWPADVARILDKVLWAEVKLAHRTVGEIAAELHALERKAVAQAKAVKAHMAGGKLSVEEAVAKVMEASPRGRARRHGGQGNSGLAPRTGKR